MEYQNIRQKECQIECQNICQIGGDHSKKVQYFFIPLGQLARLVAQSLMQWEVEPEKILNLSQGIQDLL